MAVTDDRPAGRPRAVRTAEHGPSSAEPSPFDRQPPQDLTAEQSVLGGMLLSKDAIADVVEVLRPDDFYRPAHQTVYDCILDLYGRGEPADAVTVSAELQRRGDLIRLGGAPYLHTLIATVPTAANAAYYAEIVAEKAVLRRLVEAGTRIVQLGYHGAAEGGEVNDVVDRAQAAIYEVTERSTSEDYVALEELLQPTMDEIDAIASRGGVALGVPTGFADLDAATNGLHPGQMIVVAARPGLGKALALDTPLPTPGGWTTMGEVCVGDRLVGADGRPVRVAATTGVMRGRPCFEVEFSDGTVLVADAGHQWLTSDLAARRARRAARERGGPPQVLPAIRTTAELAVAVPAAGGARPGGTGELPGHSVQACAPLQLPERVLPVDPYALGVLHGATAPGAVPAGAAPASVLPGGSGPDDTRRIPAAYLRASEGQRRALLAGLMDAAGEVTPAGALRFRTHDRTLLEEVRELVAGLGLPCAPGPSAGTAAGDRPAGLHTLTFASAAEVFRVDDRKRRDHKERSAGQERHEHPHHIVDVRPVPSVPVRCVEVDGDDHLYLAGRSMVPTHNSTLGLDFARSCSVRHGMTSAVFSLEMSRSEIVMRLLSAEARIRLSDMRAGRMSDDDWTRMARRMSEISEAPLFIDDSPNLTLMEIRAKARRLKQRNDLKLVILDYLQLMTSGRKVESRQQEVSEFSRQIKLLAKELEVPVVAISQLNRGPEQRTDKRPMLADLRESGSIEQDADMVVLLHRPDAFERDDPRAGEADLILAKHRNGPTSTVTVAHQLHYSRFADLAHG
jgi:replicative DNA helicase